MGLRIVEVRRVEVTQKRNELQPQSGCFFLGGGLEYERNPAR